MCPPDGSIGAPPTASPAAITAVARPAPAPQPPPRPAWWDEAERFLATLEQANLPSTGSLLAGIRDNYRLNMDVLRQFDGWDLHNQLNVLTQTYWRQLKIVARLSRDMIDFGLPSLSTNERETLRAVWGRTLKWANTRGRKITCIVTVREFHRGLRDDETGELLIDERGLCHFAGTNMSPNTFQPILDRLVSSIKWNYRSTPKISYHLTLNWPLVLIAADAYRPWKGCDDTVDRFVVEALQTGRVTLAMLQALDAEPRAGRQRRPDHDEGYHDPNTVVLEDGEVWRRQ
jgi:hypothetical protein